MFLTSGVTGNGYVNNLKMNHSMFATLGKGLSGITGISLSSLVFAEVESPVHLTMFVLSTTLITFFTVWNLILDNMKKRSDRKKEKHGHHKD